VALVLGAGVSLAFGATVPPKKAATPAKPATSPARPAAPAARPAAKPGPQPSAAAVESTVIAGDEYEPAPAKKPYPAVFPDGAGKEIADAACLFCHSAMLVTQQAKDSAAWEKTINQMIAWGSPVTPQQHDSLRVYFLKHLGPQPMAPAAAPTPGPKK
jgi:cytochrome c5